MSKLQDINNKLNELKKQASEQFSEAFLEYVQFVFEKYPELESFGFHGYVPYFNDGEECTFSVTAYQESIDINGESGYCKYDDGKTWHHQAAQELSGLIEEISDELYQTAWGSHWEVTVTKDKVDISEYSDHD